MRAARTDANHAEVVKALRAWECAHCGAHRMTGLAHLLRMKYCDRECSDGAYLRLRATGDTNPNYRGTSVKRCQQCGNSYESYDKSRKFCGKACYAASRPAAAVKPPKLVKPPKPPKLLKARAVTRIYQACRVCGDVFPHPRSAPRMYCSYACHIASGGAVRAGAAARIAKMKYGAKKDANHKEIFEILRKHCHVFDLSDMGRGLPDGLAWVDGRWEFFDVKNPNTGYGRRGLNKVQQAWVEQWQGGAVYLIYNDKEAEKFGRGEFDGLKRVESNQSKVVE